MTSALSSRERLRVLVLCEMQWRIAATVKDHLNALPSLSAHKVRLLPMRRDLPAPVELERFDVVVVHYTLVAADDRYLSPTARARIGAFTGLKAIFIQDEYRHIDRTLQAMRDMGMHVLFTCVQEESVEEVYPEAKLPGVRKVTVLTGYVPEKLARLSVPPPDQRPIDVGYRARKLPAWLGAISQEKWIIGQQFQKDARPYHLKCDIAFGEENRLYGHKWTRFLTSCKAVLGTESGASLCDFSGEIQAKVEAHLQRDPDASFDTLSELYFKKVDGRVTIRAISPRCFEAAALRTLMILYEGDYSGRLIPWRHYVPLKKDHSNMDEVVQVLRDFKQSKEIVDRAYHEVALNPHNGFQAMVDLVDRVLEERFVPEMRSDQAPYRKDELEKITQIANKWRRIRELQFRLVWFFYLLFHKVILNMIPTRYRLRFRTRVVTNLRRIKRAGFTLVTHLRRALPGGGAR